MSLLKIIQTPAKYVQGPNALEALGQYVAPLADSAFVIADKFVWGLVDKKVGASFKKEKVEFSEALFNGECSQKEIDRLGALVAKTKAKAIVGIGGGKTLDTAKAVAFYAKLPVIISPTIASTDAPTSALSVIYTDAGAFERYLFYPQNPNVVVMDTTLIAGAPARLLVAGMGDALSTYFEARACSAASKPTMVGGLTTQAALALAKLCYDVLLEDGYKAKLAAESKVSTKALENIVEANTLLSGLGFESAGLAAAHAVHNGLTSIEECHGMYHGEKVAFGVLVQLALENAPTHEVETVLDFLASVGLPTTLAQLGLADNAPGYHDKLKKAAELSCAKDETIHNMPFAVTPEAVYAAIVTADKLGRDWVF